MTLASILAGALLLSSTTALAANPPEVVAWQQPQPSQGQPSSSSNQTTGQTSSAGQNPGTSKATPGSAQPCPTPSQNPAVGQPPCSTTKKHRKPKPPVPPNSDSSKKIVRNGGTSEPAVQLAPDVPPQQSSQESQTAAELLASTDANLKQAVGRSLTAEQQDTVKQVKNYMEQAKAAATDGDVQRAYNLALKANLLSADLVGH